jgi:hypothetical protein
MIRSLSLALGLLLLAAAPAHAEQVELTAQARAADAEFLLTATPPRSAATICMVDTGVNVNPDTSGVIARLTISDAPSDQSPTLHGTQMAMFISAQRNAFGTVGFWPAARIVSVRANIAGQDRFSPSDYTDGVKLCSDVATLFGVKVIVLPLSSELPLAPEDASDLKEELAAAHDVGINVVAAAGNLDGRAVGTPANLPGVISVGATHSGTGALCGFSAASASFLAPGCGLDGADPATGAPSLDQQGTSEASAIFAAALAALRTWRPDLSADDAAGVLRSSATRTTAGPGLDLAAAFRASGLTSIVGEPVAAVPSPQPPPQPTATPSAPKSRLLRPKIHVRSRGAGRRRTVVVKATNRPARTQLSVSVYARTSKGKLRLTVTRIRTSATVEIRTRSWRRIKAHFVDPTKQRLDSAETVFNNHT